MLPAILVIVIVLSTGAMWWRWNADRERVKEAHQKIANAVLLVGQLEFDCKRRDCPVVNESMRANVMLLSAEVEAIAGTLPEADNAALRGGLTNIQVLMNQKKTECLDRQSSLIQTPDR